MKPATREALNSALDATRGFTGMDHWGDCPHRDCENECSEGEDCVEPEHKCVCSVDAIAKLRAAVKFALAEEPAT